MRILAQLAVVILLAAGIGAWYWSAERGSESAAGAGQFRAGARPVGVVVATPRVDRATIAVEAVGTALANEAVVVTPKVSGIVARIAFSEGARVRAGAVLAELDASELKANLEEERAALKQARRLLERARALYRNRAVSKARIDQLEAELEAAEARVRADEARLQDHVIRAPFGGRLGLRRVSPGALVGPGSTITTLDDTSRIKVDFRVPESVLSLARPGLPIEARSVSYDETFHGVVKTLDSRVDPATRSIELRTEFPNPDGRLKPGMFLTARIAIDSRDGAILVPEEALVAQGATHFVFLVRDGKAIRTRVRIGVRLAGEVEIRDGVAATDEVVVRGLQKIRDGSAVRVVAPGQGAQGGGTG